MKTFKIAELLLNMALVLFFGIRYAVTGEFNDLIEGYFVVGAIQVIGMIIHRVFHWFTHKNSRRYIYNWITLITVALMPTGGIFYLLLWTAAPMAVYYTLICGLEIQKIYRREFIHLKN